MNSEGLRFDDGVPVKTIHLSPEGIKGLSADEYEIIGTSQFCKLAQTPASYTTLRYEQPVVMLKSIVLSSEELERTAVRPPPIVVIGDVVAVARPARC